MRAYVAVEDLDVPRVLGESAHGQFDLSDLILHILSNNMKPRHRPKEIPCLRAISRESNSVSVRKRTFKNTPRRSSW
jgi:hypothetical protein